MSADDLPARLPRVLDRIDPAPAVHTATLLAIHTAAGAAAAPAVPSSPAVHSAGEPHVHDQFKPGGSR